MAQRTLVGQGLLIIEALWSHSDTPHSVWLLRMGDQSDAETSTCKSHNDQRDKHPCPPRDSNPQSQQPSGHSLRYRGHWDRHTVYCTNYMHILNWYKHQISLSSNFRYMCTILKENTMSILNARCSVLPEDDAHVPKHFGEAHLMFILINNVHLFGIINNVHWFTKCMKWTTLKRQMLPFFRGVIRHTFSRLRQYGYFCFGVTRRTTIFLFFLLQLNSP